MVRERLGKRLETVRGSKWSGRSCKTLRNGLRGAGRCRALGGLGKALGGPWSILNVFLATEIFQAPDPRGVLQQGARDVPAKTLALGLGSLPLHLRGRAPSGRHGGGSRPALPGLHDDLCRSRSSGVWGLGFRA